MVSSAEAFPPPCRASGEAASVLPSPHHPVLSGSAVGSCLVSEDNSWNLGVVQISPQVAANGSLSIVYVNGDKCGTQRYSTRITFECAQTSVRAWGAWAPFAQSAGPEARPRLRGLWPRGA